MKNKIALLSLFAVFSFTVGAQDCNEQQIDTNFGNDTIVCAGENVVVNFTMDICDGGCPGGCSASAYDIFEWRINDVLQVDETEITMSGIPVTETIVVQCSAIDTTSSEPDSIIVAFKTFLYIELPEIEISIDPGSDPLCDGNNIELIATADSDHNIDNGDLDWDGVDIQSNYTAQINQAEAAEHVVNFSATDEYGCENNENFVVVVNDLPNININVGDEDFCEGEIITATATPANGSAAFDTCDWELGGGDALSSDHTFNVSAMFPLHNDNWIVDVIDVNGCEGSAFIQVDVTDAPSAEIDFPQTVFCDNEEFIQFTCDPDGGSFETSGDCDDFPPASNPINANNKLFFPDEAGPGVFCIVYQVGDGDCLATDMVTVTVHDAPEPEEDEALPESCINGPDINLNLTVEPQGGVFYLCDSGTTIPGGILDPDHPDVDQGDNAICYEITDSNGCVGEVDYFIDINSELTAFTNDDIQLCEGASAQLGINGSGGGGGNLSYSWSPSDGLTNPDSTSPSVTNAQATTTYTGTVTNNWNCTASAQQTVTVYATPTISSVTSDPPGFCNVADLDITVNNNWVDNDWGIVPSYDWVFSGTTVTTGSHTHSFPEVDEELLIVINVDFNPPAAGCASVSGNITVAPVPVPTPELFVSDEEICSGQQVLFSVANQTFGSDYEWWFNPAPDSEEIIGNGNAVIAVWDDVAGANIDVTLFEQLSNCQGSVDANLTFDNGLAPSPADIQEIAGNILVYGDSSPDCYQWGYIDADGSMFLLYNEDSGLPETSQSIALDEINSSWIYFCEAWNGDCAASGCSTFSYYDENFVGVQNFGISNEMRIFPNPSTGSFWLDLPEFTTSPTARVTNAMGQVVFEIGLVASSDQLIPFDLNHLSSGMYILSIVDNHNVISSSRIIIDK